MISKVFMSCYVKGLRQPSTEALPSELRALVEWSMVGGKAHRDSGEANLKNHLSI